MKNGSLLHIEDDEDDIIFLALAFEDAGITNSIQVVRDGQEALDYFKSRIARSEHGQASLPALVLLDLKLPRVNGLEVLRWLRQQPTLRQLPVLVLTASDHPADLEQARELGANAYVIKSSDLGGRKTFAQGLKLWLLEQGDLPHSPSWRLK